MPWQAASVQKTVVRGSSVVDAGHLVGEKLAVDRLAGDSEPPLPLLWGLQLMIGVEQEIPADRASAILLMEQPQPAFVQRWQGFLAPPVGPISGQGRIIE